MPLPDWKRIERQSQFSLFDPGTFQYFYWQVRRDFENGFVVFKSDKVQKRKILKISQDTNRWWVALFSQDKEESKEKIYGKIMDIVMRNVAVDIIEGRIDRKEILKHYKNCLPKDMFNWAENLISSCMGSKLENYVNRMLEQNREKAEPLKIIGIMRYS